jgi:8-oxo-dGTP pyrophosphatase MutT (NUDIX family)
MYSRLIELLAERLTMALPSAEAHDPLRAIPIGNVIPKFEHKVPPKLGSVMVLLYEENGQIKFPLIKRAEYNGAHSGQISLPGGKAEPGEDAVQTALRECEEEIGIKASSIKVIGRLSEFYVIPSNFLVTPVVGTLNTKPLYNPDPYEVFKVIEANVHDLMREDAIRTKEILAAGHYRMNAPHFEIENEVVWGATAMMLNELRIVLREILG